MPRCSLAASKILVLLLPSCWWLYAVRLLTCLTFWANVAPSCRDPFLRQSALNPHVSVRWILPERRESCHTPIQGSDSDVSSAMFQIIIGGRLLRCTKACFSFVSAHQYNSEVSENRPSEHGVSSLEQHDSDFCFLTYYFRNLVELQDLDLDLKLILFLEMFLENIARGRLPLCTQRWITAVLLAIFRPFYLERENDSLLNVHLF